MAGKKGRVLIVGATGYLGRRFVKASMALGHPTFVLYRPKVASDAEKVQMLIGFKMEGATLLQGSFNDFDSLVSAVAANHLRHRLDVDRMEHAIPTGDYVFADKRVIRRAIEKANIPYTYVSANCCAGYFLAAIAQVDHIMPPTDHVLVYGNGDKKCIWVDEDDMAMHTMLAVDDPRTLNKTLYLRPRDNILRR
ncbi:bifunctional pinoresinol-lariciresinol reductase 2-like [Aristolochia californica]|uniref:bifunctional pinoresinol-lariciresinol reductase 2-like n=1 Tax=Aristolochia californica TaxID=171875 RepID=UPI0035D5F362